MTHRILEGTLAAVGILLMALGVSAHVRALSHAAHPVVGATAPAPPPRRLAIVNARVFDGAAVLERASVVVEDGVIRGVGAHLAVPAGATVVNGEGRTLLPGLIDAHAHAFGDALERALVFGVTTELDMFTDPQFAAARRDEQRRGPVPTRADLLSAGVLATAPGGHGTEYRLSNPDADESGAGAGVRRRADRGRIGLHQDRLRRWRQLRAQVPDPLSDHGGGRRGCDSPPGQAGRRAPEHGPGGARGH